MISHHARNWWCLCGTYNYYTRTKCRLCHRPHEIVVEPKVKLLLPFFCPGRKFFPYPDKRYFGWRAVMLSPIVRVNKLTIPTN